MSTATLKSGGHILTLAGQKNLSQEGCDALVQTGTLADLFEAAGTGVLRSLDREKFREFLKLGPLVFRVLVDYGLSLADMIAAGKYDWVNIDITAERFPVSRISKEEVLPEPIHFDREMSSEEVVAELDKIGYRPATFHELLAFGATYPDIQRQFPIVALGSGAEIGGKRHVGSLDGHGTGRGLLLYWWDSWWLVSFRFLAVRQNQPSDT